MEKLSNMAVLTGGGLRRQPDGDEGKMVDLQGGHIERAPLEEIVGGRLATGLYELTRALARMTR